MSIASVPAWDVTQWCPGCAELLAEVERLRTIVASLIELDVEQPGGSYVRLLEES